MPSTSTSTFPVFRAARPVASAAPTLSRRNRSFLLPDISGFLNEIGRTKCGNGARVQVWQLSSGPSSAHVAPNYVSAAKGRRRGPSSETQQAASRRRVTTPGNDVVSAPRITRASSSSSSSSVHTPPELRRALHRSGAQQLAQQLIAAPARTHTRL